MENNGYAFVPAGAAAVTALADSVRVLIPVSGDFGWYMAVDGDNTDRMLAELATRFDAETLAGTTIETVDEQMPTRREPPEAFVGFAVLKVDPAQYQRVAREAAAVDETIGLAGAPTADRLLVEFTGSDEHSVEKPYQRLLDSCGDAIRESAFGAGAVAAGSWRDA